MNCHWPVTRCCSDPVLALGTGRSTNCERQPTRRRLMIKLMGRSWTTVPTDELEPWQRYVVAAAFAAVATGVQVVLYYAGGSRYMIYFVAVVMSAWFAGFRPALMTTGIAVVVGSWLEKSDLSTAATDPGTSKLAVTVPFVLTCTFLAFVCNNARQARQRLQRGLAEMQDEVVRREQAIEARIAAEAEVNAFFLLAGVGMAITEARTGRFLRVNPELCRMLDYAEEEVLKLHYLDVTPPEDRAWTTQQLAPFSRGETTFLHLENRLLLKNGSYLWVDAIGTELPASANHPRRMIVIFLDLTDRKTAEMRISEADRRKDEFLAMLSHELRNPLAAIRQALQLADDDADVATRQWTGEVVGRQTSQLTRMVDDLLDVARFQAGKIKVNLEPVDVGEVLDHAVKVAEALFGNREHAFSRNYARGLWVNGDAARIEQIVVNLLTNAAKYTGCRGKIELEAKPRGLMIEIAVRDNGQGMAPGKIAEMFEIFVQGERSLARPEGGLGLGLAIVRQLVSLHGGDIEARSDGVGHGSEFIVTLPRIDAPAANSELPPKVSRRSSLEGMKILVVDDHQDTAISLARLLERAGAEVTTVHDGITALDRAATFRPDAVLLDLGLPGCDGFEVARRIRAKDGDRVLIIATSGYGTENDRARSAAAGCDEHLLKPVDFDRLRALLSSGRPGPAEAVSKFEK